MKTRKLSERDFARAIRHGLGSAFLHVKEYGDKGVEKQLLKACLTNLVYDKQIDSCRAAWLARMLDHTGRISDYARAIKESLTAVRNTDDCAQLIRLGVELFERGFVEYRTILLNSPGLHSDNYHLVVLAEAMVDVASTKGFQMAAHLLMKSDSWDKTFLYEHAMKTVSSEAELKELLEVIAKDDNILAQYLKEVESELTARQQRQKTSPPAPWTLEQLLCAIDGTHDQLPPVYVFRRFGKTASQAELECILERLKGEKDAERLERYLGVFSEIPLPHVPDIIPPLIFVKQEKLRLIALTALSNTRSAQIRDMGLGLLRSDKQDDLTSGLSLLEQNYEVNDTPLLMTTLLKLKNKHHKHSAARSLLKMAEVGNEHILADFLIWVYNFNPCGFCRNEAVRLLINCQAMPAQLLYEAQWDAEQDIRSIARSAFGSETLSEVDSNGE